MTNPELHQLGEMWRQKAVHIREKYKNTAQAQAASDVALTFETCAEDVERWLTTPISPLFPQLGTISECWPEAKQAKREDPATNDGTPMENFAALWDAIGSLPAGLREETIAYYERLKKERSRTAETNPT